MRPLKVLIVDDEYWLRENLRNLLATLGPGLNLLEPACDGEEALARVESDQPDLLITDIDMPFLSGNQLIKAVKERFPLVQSVVLSGYSDFSYVREALMDGALDYLLKPVNPTVLAKIVDRVRDIVEGRIHDDQAAASAHDDEVFSRFLEDQGDSLVAPRFPVGFLLLVRIGDPPRWAPESQGEPRLSVFQIKALAARESQGSGQQAVFHNPLCVREYLVLTDRDEERTGTLARRLSENLGRFLGTRVEIGVSQRFFAPRRVREAYREARSSLYVRLAGAPPTVVFFGQVCGRKHQGRLSAEQERRLALAIGAEDQDLIRRIIFEEVGLRTQAAGWLLAEVLQTVVYVAGLVAQRVPDLAASRLGLSQETFHGQITRAIQDGNLVEVCSLVDGWIDEVFGDRPGTSTASLPMRQTVRLVRDHIEGHYFDNLSLASLAEKFRVESSYLSKAFKQVTGMNLMSAIAHRRIEKAKEYILDRSLSLTEVGSLVGYEEYAYFSRVFHKIEGLSPSDYRTRAGKGET